MPRNFRRQSRKDSRRAIRWAGIARKRGLLHLAMLAAVMTGAAGTVLPGLAIAQDQGAFGEVAKGDFGPCSPGMESPQYTLIVWVANPGSGEWVELPAATHVGGPECFSAMGTVIAAGGDASCLPMGRIAGLAE